ncbi:MAG: hypothetical protein AB7P76_00410 [Candidatus Melainabacteria bacterium]
MSSLFERNNNVIDLTRHPDFKRIRDQVENQLQSSLTDKKRDAVRTILEEEFNPQRLHFSEDFVNAVIRRIDDEVFTEQRYIFLALNPAYATRRPALTPTLTLV